MDKAWVLTLVVFNVWDTELDIIIAIICLPFLWRSGHMYWFFCMNRNLIDGQVWKSILRRGNSIYKREA